MAKNSLYSLYGVCFQTKHLTFKCKHRYRSSYMIDAHSVGHRVPLSFIFKETINNCLLTKKFLDVELYVWVLFCMTDFSFERVRIIYFWVLSNLLESTVDSFSMNNIFSENYIIFRQMTMSWSIINIKTQSIECTNSTRCNIQLHMSKHGLPQKE